MFRLSNNELDAGVIKEYSTYFLCQTDKSIETNMFIKMLSEATLLKQEETGHLFIWDYFQQWMNTH